MGRMGMDADPRDRLVEQLRSENTQLRAENTRLDADNTQLRETIHRLREPMEALERQAHRSAAPFRPTGAEDGPAHSRSDHKKKPAATPAERGKHTWEILASLIATCQQTARDLVQTVRPYLVLQPA